MRRSLIGALVVLVIAGTFLAVRLGGRHAARATLDQSLANLPPGYTATHGATDYDPITDTLTVHDLVLNRDGRKVAAAAKLIVSDSHPAALQAVFDPASYPDGKPAWTDRRALLGHVELNGLEIDFTTPNTPPLTIRHLVLDKLAGRPFIRPPTSANASAIDFETDVAQALAVKSLLAEKLAFSDAENGHVTVASEALDDYDGGKLASFTIGSVDVSSTSPKVSFSLAKMAFAGVDGQAALEKLGPSGGLDPLARRQVALQAYGLLRMSSADIEGLALKATPGPRIEVATQHLAAEQASDGTRTSHGTLRGLTVSAADMELPPSAHTMLAELGSDRIVADGDSDVQTNEARHHVEVRRMDFALHDLGTLHLMAVADGYDRSAIQAGPAGGLSAAMKLVIGHAALSWDDASLTSKIIGVMAQRQGATPEQIRAAAAMPLAALSIMVPDQPDAGAQVSAFLDHPHHLGITLDPPAPISLGQVATLPVPERAHALGLKIEGN